MGASPATKHTMRNAPDDSQSDTMGAARRMGLWRLSSLASTVFDA